MSEVGVGKDHFLWLGVKGNFLWQKGKSGGIF